MTKPYARLLEPVSIGSLTVRNRIGMAPMNNTTQMDLLTGAITQRSVEYYVERARGGVGLIITGVFKVENEIEVCMDLGTGVMRWPLVTAPTLPILSEMISRIHGHGAKIFFQLSAGPGRVTRKDVIDSGVVPVSASDNTCFFSPETVCRPLAIAGVESIVDAFGAAAEIMKTAGADGVDIHGHEGYLLDQFATALWNRRDDKYGGDLAGRSRLAREIREKIADRVGWDFPVSYRLGVKHHITPDRPGGTDSEEAGRDVEESIALARLLVDYGYDALNLDVGAYESGFYAHPAEYVPQGFSLADIGRVAKSTSVPVFAAGKLGRPDVALKAVEEHDVDIVLLGRALLADPDWPAKIATEPETIKPCIGCDVGCRPKPSGIPLGCSVNPPAGREIELQLRPALKPGRIAVIGGGVAGMEAARTARLRGHEVLLFEKSSQLGGRLKSIAVPSFKGILKELLDWYQSEMERLGIELRLGTSATAGDIFAAGAGAAIWATGASEGKARADFGSWSLSATAALASGGVSDTDVTVIGNGGSIGAEMALWAAGQGKRVTLLEKEPNPFAGQWWARSAMLKELLRKEQVTFQFGDCGSDLQRYDAESAVIVVASSVSNRKSYDLARLELNIPNYLVGDAVSPRDLHAAIWEGFHAGISV